MFLKDYKSAIKNIFSNKVIYFGNSILDENHYLRQIVGYCAGIGTKVDEYLDSDIHYIVSEDIEADKEYIYKYLYSKMTEVNKASIIRSRIQQYVFISIYDFYDLVRTTKSGVKYLPKEEQYSSFITMNIASEKYEKHDTFSEIAICVVKNGKIDDKFFFLINEEDEQSSFEYIYENFLKKYFDEFYYVIAFNLSTHRSHLEKTLAKYEIEPPLNRFICAMNWFKDIIEEVEDYKFETITKSLEIDNNPTTNQNLNKAISTAKIVLYLINNHQESLFMRYRDRIKLKVDFNKYDLIDTYKLKVTDYFELPDDFFRDKKVVVTGGCDIIKQDDLKEIISRKGAKILSSFTSKTEVIIIGNKPGINKINALVESIASGNNVTILLQENISPILLEENKTGNG